MEKENKNNIPLTAAQNGKEKTDGNKKYNFYRKPSIKRKAPEVKQTLTSYRRMLKANPLLKYEMEGKDFSLINNQIPSSSQKVDSALSKQSSQPAQPEKQSLQPNTNSGKLLPTNLQRSKSVKNPPMNFSQPKPLKKNSSSIISGCKPTKGANTNSINISKHVEFNKFTSGFLCSTPLENNRDENKKRVVDKSKHVPRTKTKAQLQTQDNCVSSSGHLAAPAKTDKKVKKVMRRSLSAQHFDSKKGLVRLEPEKCYTRVELTQSLSDISSLPNAPLHTVSPIAEGSRETSVIFKTPSAYERRSIARFTPKSVASIGRSLYHTATPLPSLNDLQKRLNDWLTKRGKSLSTFHHLKCFGVQVNGQTIDEENKENIEVVGGAIKDSYEDLKIIISPENSITSEPALNAESAESVAKAALEDLLRLIQEGYPRPQCEGWLELIRRKYRKLEEEPQYWECRAAIEQSRGNISNAVQCYKTAIVQGAEIQAVDESLDILLKKFSLLNISTDQVKSEQSVKERARIVQDARNVFKSSIIQFAVQERKLKKNVNEGESRTLVATPVRRSTRLSRSAYTSTPGVKICSSLRELDKFDMDMVDFKKNKALF